MRATITDEQEEKLYYFACNISKVCRKYFYNRKYLPNDFWSITDVVNNIYREALDMKKTYDEIKKENKIDKK